MNRLCTALVLVCLVSLPLFAGSNKGWEIVRADYGSGNNWVDVTDRVRSLVQGSALNFRVDRNTLGVNRGRNQTLRLQLKDSNGRSRRVTYRDNQNVNLQVYSAYQSNLHINRAIYGSDYRSADVTSRLNSQIQRDQLNLQVNNDSMGGDPDPGQNKTLNVEYTINGRSEQSTVHEGDTLNLPYNDGNTGTGSLQINRAVYGSSNRSSDVTSRLNSQIQGDQLNLQVNNDNMGGDPDPGQNKTLTVDYTLNGRNERSTVREGDMLRLSNSNSNTNTGLLKINRATYGSYNRTSDVTSRVRSQVQGNQINMQVNNDSMGGDPDPGQNKMLTVDYTLNGRSAQSIVREGDTLNLQSGNSGSLPQRNTSSQSQIIRCESNPSSDNGRKYCSANTRGGVRLSRRLGNAECIEGSSWGYDNNGVWVDNGCRAEFELHGNGRSTVTTNSTTIKSGTALSVRTNETIDSKNVAVGQTFSAVIAADVLDSSGLVAIPKGSGAQLVIRSSSGGSITSASDLVLDVKSLTVNGTNYIISTGDLDEKSRQGVGANQRTAIMVGGGAVLGTIIGAIAGGGRGAAIGAAVGAGAGVGTEILTKGKEVRIPAETILNFKLDQDLNMQMSR